MLGPADGRYLVRARDASGEDAPTHVLVLARLDAAERRRLLARSSRQAQPQPEPTPVSTSRVTVIEVGEPLPGARAAAAWLGSADEEVVQQAIAVVNRVLHAHRVITADPAVGPVAREQAIAVRVGFGAGEQVADGLWRDARELPGATPRTRRVKVLQPQARLAAVLGARERVLACEELVLRARLDLDQGRTREAALQLLVALDAAIAELGRDPTAPALSERLVELRTLREPTAAAAQAALAGELDADQRERVQFAVGRIEAALRARAVANA